MVAPLAAGLIGGAVASGASAGLAGLMKPGKKLSQSQLGQLRGFLDAGGIRTTNIGENRGVGVEVDPRRTQLVEGLANIFRTQGGQLGDLRTKLTAGRGALTEARLAQIDAGERAALGDLRSNLARRRVAGSSWAADAEAGTREKFARTRAEESALGVLETLGLNVDMIKAENASYAAAFETSLNELNLQASTAMSILTSSQASVGALSETTAQMAALFKGAALAAGSDALGQLGKLPEALATK